MAALSIPGSNGNMEMISAHSTVYGNMDESGSLSGDGDALRLGIGWTAIGIVCFGVPIAPRVFVNFACFGLVQEPRMQSDISPDFVTSIIWTNVSRIDNLWDMLNMRRFSNDFVC